MKQSHEAIVAYSQPNRTSDVTVDTGGWFLNTSQLANPFAIMGLHGNKNPYTMSLQVCVIGFRPILDYS